MSEVTLRDPLPLVWVGRRDRVPKGPKHWPRAGFAYFAPKRGAFEAQDLDPAFDWSRRPIVVTCPLRYGMTMVDGSVVEPDVLLGATFCIDKLSTVKREPWKVTVDVDSLIVGERPRITVKPSIHLVGIWHGWLDDGVLHQ